MSKELTQWNNLRMVLGIIPFEGVKDKPPISGHERGNSKRLSYQYHNYEIVKSEDLKRNRHKAELL